MKKHKSFEATLSDLPEMLSFVTSPIKELKLPPSLNMKIEVALEEALVNIIHYAYPSHLGEIEIDWGIIENEKLVIKITDHGRAFNPLEKASSVAGYIPVEERKIGGLGIPFILNIMDHVEYLREDNANILILTKYFQHDQ